MMQSLLRYKLEFERVHGICYVVVRVADILEDMIFSNFLPANFRGTYIR